MHIRRTRWVRFLCWIGWHQQIGATVANYIRCYSCDKDYDEARKVWVDHPAFLKSLFYQARCEQLAARLYAQEERDREVGNRG
jgi:hypothetical protein